MDKNFNKQNALSHEAFLDLLKATQGAAAGTDWQSSRKKRKKLEKQSAKERKTW